MGTDIFTKLQKKDENGVWVNDDSYSFPRHLNTYHGYTDGQLKDRDPEPFGWRHYGMYGFFGGRSMGYIKQLIEFEYCRPYPDGDRPSWAFGSSNYVHYFEDDQVFGYYTKEELLGFDYNQIAVIDDKCYDEHYKEGMTYAEAMRPEFMECIEILRAIPYDWRFVFGLSS